MVLVGGFLTVAALIEGGDRTAPRDHAVELVPREALLYVHTALDRDSAQWRRGGELFKQLPGLARLRNRAVRALTPGRKPLDPGRELEPWVGGEAALALLPGKSGARSLIVVEVSDRELARDFLERAVGRQRKTSYRGTPVRLYGKLAAAFLGDFLVIGQLAKVRRAIDARAGRVRSLQHERSFRRARRKLSDEERLVYAYASPAGVRRLLRPRRDLIGRLATVVDDPSLEGAAASVHLEEGGARVRFASVLERSVRDKARASRFDPELPGAVPGEALAYLGMRGVDRILDVTDQVGGGQLPFAATLARLESDLNRAGLRLARALRPLLRKEAALFVTTTATRPVVTVAVDDVDEQDSQEVLDRLQPLFAGALGDTSTGQVPTLEPRRIAGVNAATLRITPTLQLTYAFFGDRAVVSTSGKGIQQIRASESPIRQNPRLEDMLDDLGPVTSVLFLDLQRLLALGEQTGLGETRGYRALRSDLAGIGTVSAVTRAEAGSTKAEIFIEVQ